MFDSTSNHPGGRAEDHEVGSSHFSGWGSRAAGWEGGLSLKGKPLVSHVCQPGLTFQNSTDSWGPNRQIHEAVGDTSRSGHSLVLKDVLTEGPHNPVFILMKLSYQHQVGSPQICLSCPRASCPSLLSCAFPGILPPAHTSHHTAKRLQSKGAAEAKGRVSALLEEQGRS